MPKMKTHRGAAKRFKITGRGKVRRRHALKRHILTIGKSRKRKRRLRRAALVSKADEAQTKRLLPYWKKS